MAPHIGTATSRVDGVAKVTGAAKYAAEFNVPGLSMRRCTSTIPGSLTHIATSAAMSVKGVWRADAREPPPWRTMMRLQ